MKNYRIIISLLSLTGFLFMFYSAVNSLPRLSVDHSTGCKSCHINPSGGGMRTEFGSFAIALNERTLPQTKQHFVNRYRSPRISEGLTIGFDSRYLVLESGRVFRMQSDFFAAVEPLKDFYYNFRFSETGISEHYALMFFDSRKKWAKLGRFTPSFGLKNSDHKMFNRERIGLGSNVYIDGLSFGADLRGLQVTAELFNPDDRAMVGLHMIKTGYLEPLGFMLGGSFRLSEKIDGSTGQFPTARSLFGGIAYDRLDLLAEIDLVGQSSDTMIVYAGLTGRVEYGLHLIAEYSFFDGNRHLKDGVEEFTRFSVEFFPVPFVQLRPSYTRYTKGPLADEDDFFLQFYVGY